MGEAATKRTPAEGWTAFRLWLKRFLIKIKFEKWKGWIYLSPCIILLLVFTVWPLFNTLRMAFWNGYGLMDEIGMQKLREEYIALKGIDPGNLYPFQFGFNNFSNVIAYVDFWQCMKNTMLLTVLTVPISTLLALVIAVCLNSIRALNRLLQTIYFLPYVTNSIAIGMVFATMFNMIGLAPDGSGAQSYGVINDLLMKMNLPWINWMNASSEYWANITVMVVYIVWNALPFKILILLGGLQSVNKQYYDAAKIDSTPKLRVFTRITVPLLSPMIVYVVITGFIGGFKEYSSIVGVFGETMKAPGTPHTLNTMVGYIYEQLNLNHQGQASAAALILFAIIFVVTMINMTISKKTTHY